jgi:hypothetical protein
LLLRWFLIAIISVVSIFFLAIAVILVGDLLKLFIARRGRISIKEVILPLRCNLV